MTTPTTGAELLFELAGLDPKTAAVRIIPTSRSVKSFQAPTASGKPRAKFTPGSGTLRAPASPMTPPPAAPPATSAGSFRAS